jgi:ATPase subunit of ABC transporter with duplicated ATPase domains
MGPILFRLPWRYIGAAAGVIALLWAAYSWAYARGVRSRDSEVARLAVERETAISNAATLEAAIARQNAAARTAEAQTKAAQDMARNAARMAQERDRALAGVKARLDAAARSGGDVAGCEVPVAAREAWGAM